MGRVVQCCRFWVNHFTPLKRETTLMVPLSDHGSCGKNPNTEKQHAHIMKRKMKSLKDHIQYCFG